jgi:arsenite methyltransferase
MTLSKLIATQLGHPTGLFARLAGSLWNRRNAVLNDHIFELLELQPTDRVLDIGFGGGYLLDRMAAVVTHGSLEGVDVSTAMVRQAEKRYRKKVNAEKLSFTCASVESLPYPDRHFTKICSVNSIFYWQNFEKAFREIKRVADHAGKVAICLTCKKSIEGKGFSKNLHLLENNEVVQLFSSNGFENIQTHAYSDKYRLFVCILGESNS